MGLNGSDRIPAHAGPGRIVLFQMIGMKLDEAGNDIVPVHGLAGAHRTGDNFGNPAIPDHDVSLNHFIGQNDPRIAQDQLISHQANFLFCIVPPTACIDFTKNGSPRRRSTKRESVPISSGSSSSGVKSSSSALCIVSASLSGTLPVSVIWKRKSSKTWGYPHF